VSEVQSELASADAALTRAVGLAHARRDEAGRRVRAAELGPHGRSDEIQAASELQDRWGELVDDIEQVRASVSELVREAEDLA
jgi:hypothetical protein